MDIAYPSNFRHTEKRSFDVLALDGTAVPVAVAKPTTAIIANIPYHVRKRIDGRKIVREVQVCEIRKIHLRTALPGILPKQGLSEDGTGRKLAGMGGFPDTVPADGLQDPFPGACD